MRSSHGTMDSLDTLQGAAEELIPVNILCWVFLSLIMLLLCIRSPLILAWKSMENKLSPAFATHSMHSSVQPPSFALSPRRSLLCPLTSINVMVHQWWRTLSQGRTPLLIWLLLMGENTINKFNYLWPISNSGDRIIIIIIIIIVISEVWIWRDLITEVSRNGWTGYVNIFHIHGDELLCDVKASASWSMRRAQLHWFTAWVWPKLGRITAELMQAY